MTPIKVEIFFAVTLTLQNIQNANLISVLFAIKKNFESQKELQTQ